MKFIRAVAVCFGLFLCTAPVYAGLEQVGSLDDETIKLRNVETGQVLKALTNHTSSVNWVAFSPDGKILASASFDKTIKLWDVATGKELATLTGHTQSVNSLAFNRDGTILASASDDGTVKLWDIGQRSLLATLSGHTAAVDCVAFSLSGKVLASAGWDKTIQLWDVEKRTSLKKLSGHDREITTIAFSPDGKVLASGSGDQTVRLWDPNTGQFVKTVTKESSAISAVAFSPDGKTLAVGGASIRLWNMESGSLLGALTGHSSYVKTLNFSPDGKTLASGSLDSTARLWDVATRQQLRVYKGNSFEVTSVAISPDGKTLATGSVLGSLSESASLYILTIGINNYPDNYKLRFAVADARDFADAIERAGQGLFKRINKQVLLDEGATQASIKAAFDKVIAEARPQDVFVFHYAGIDGLSKATDAKPSEFYLIPQDFSLTDFQNSKNDELLEAKAVSASVLRARLTAVMSRRQFIVLDTCSSAEAFDAFVSKIKDERPTRHHASRPGSDVITVAQELKRNIMIVAAEGLAIESPKIGHGLLTYALLQGLNGEANEMKRLFAPLPTRDVKRAHAAATLGRGAVGDADGQDTDLITTDILEAYLYSKVLILGRQIGSKMRPRVYAAGDDFALGYGPRTQTQTARTRADIVRAPEAKKPAATRTGKDYALIFATSHYNDSTWPDLPNPHNDAWDLKKVLEDQYGFTVDLQEDKTKPEIEAVLLKYMNEKNFADEDQLFVFFAGHGTYNEALEQGFVVAKDSKSRVEDPLNQTCIPHSVIYNLINKVHCKHILVVLDVCFGGTFGNAMRTGGGPDYQPVSRVERIQRAMKLQCRKYITSGGKEFVKDGDGRNSPFAFWLLDVLKRGGEEGVLTFEDIYKSVKKDSTSEPIGAAMPTDVPGSDFLLIAKAS
jgi:uncharacterized caspase-like protein